MNKIFQDILIDALNTNSWRLADNQWVTEAAQLVAEEEEEEGGGWRVEEHCEPLRYPQFAHVCHMSSKSCKICDKH